MKTSLYIKSEKITDNSQAKLKTYQYLIRKLMYLINDTKPNISFIIR